jgi:hypothetical protein
MTSHLKITQENSADTLLRQLKIHHSLLAMTQCLNQAPQNAISQGISLSGDSKAHRRKNYYSFYALQINQIFPGPRNIIKEHCVTKLIILYFCIIMFFFIHTAFPININIYFLNLADKLEGDSVSFFME